MRFVHILIKPASGMCNLQCSYCFYHDVVEKREQDSYGFMEESTLEEVIRRGLEHATQECAISFQGGEPTLAGLDFYRKAVEFQRRHNKKGVRVRNSIQTNGLLLNREWAAFLRDHHFLVGISLDGVKATHDANRLDPRGQGTFNRVAQAMQLLQSYGVDFNVLTVVNRQTAAHAGKIYRAYQRAGLGYLQFIPCLDPLGETMGAQPYSLTPKDYGAFLCSLFDLWYRDTKVGKAPSVQQFETYVEMLLGYPPKTCGMAGVCGMQYVVEADGSVYPCDFYVLDPYRLGNLTTDSFQQVDARREELGFLQRSQQVDDACRDCPHFALCRGGCRRYRPQREDGSLGRSFFCESYRQFFSYATPRLQELARLAAARLAGGRPGI